MLRRHERELRFHMTRLMSPFSGAIGFNDVTPTSDVNHMHNSQEWRTAWMTMTR